jgi:hypothetical protein
MATRSHPHARVYLTTTIDEATAQALLDGANERRMSLAKYAREVLAEHVMTQREAPAVEVKRPQDTSAS